MPRDDLSPPGTLVCLLTQQVWKLSFLPQILNRLQKICSPMTSKIVNVTDASLDRKDSLLTHAHGSFDLKITDDDPAGRPGHVDPYRDLTRSLRIGVEVVRIYSR